MKREIGEEISSLEERLAAAPPAKVAPLVRRLVKLKRLYARR
mgnify:CR=1 FL=1